MHVQMEWAHSGVSCGWTGLHPHEGLHFMEIILNIFPTPKSSIQFHFFLMSEPRLLVQRTVFMLSGKRCSYWLWFYLFLPICCLLLSSYLFVSIYNSCFHFSNLLILWLLKHLPLQSKRYSLGTNPLWWLPPCRPVSFEGHNSFWGGES